MNTIENVIQYIRGLYPTFEYIPLHQPFFQGKEKEYVEDAIDSTFVSSVGEYVNLFEKQMARLAGTQYAIATVNGTSALHTALIVAGVKVNDEVLTQALTFVAAANAITYVNASPVFIDVDRDTMGMSPAKLEEFLVQCCEKRKDGSTYNKVSGRRISACVPMHTFGFPCRIDEIAAICEQWNIPLVEDAAESIGSYYKSQHTGSFGLMGTFSFNGNKTLTCGGGGAIVTNDEKMAKLAKHLTTQAKLPHPWEFVHDHIGYNYRMPNLNAAMACAQLEQLDFVLKRKRELAKEYKAFFSGTDITYIDEIEGAKANFWLNSIAFENRQEREAFLKDSNAAKVMTRPIWQLMFRLPMFRHCFKDGQENAIYLEERIANIPSSVRSNYPINHLKHEKSISDIRTPR
jgi:aminotransferase in exopolysaccharide biosynthesis